MNAAIDTFSVRYHGQKNLTVACNHAISIIMDVLHLPERSGSTDNVWAKQDATSPNPARLRDQDHAAASAVTHRLGVVDIASLTADETDAALMAAIAPGRHLKLAFANAHVVNLAAVDARFASALGQCLVVPDGIGVDLGARLVHGAPFRANLNGTDFIPGFLARASMPLRVGLIGARPGVAMRAAAALAELAPQHAYTVFGDGYFDAVAEAALLQQLIDKRPDLLLVAFGNPRQEIWMAERLGPGHASVAAGVGALFDFLAREVVRAPEWIRLLRLEWAFRLAQEPARLWRRYLLGNPVFMSRVLAQAWRRRR
jgi:exopolysaccharide biosynthesis WecB/TagA/CpsF family protein